MTTFESGGLDGGDMGKSPGAPDLQRMSEAPKSRPGVPADYRRDLSFHKWVCGGLSYIRCFKGNSVTECSVEFFHSLYPNIVPLIHSTDGGTNPFHIP